MFNSKDNSVRNLFIGIDKPIPISDNKSVIPINFDNAATTPVFQSVLKEISKACEFYGAIGRGVGQKSEYCTKQYYKCKDYLLDFFNAPKDKYTLIFVSNTSEGLNRLSNILITNSEDIVILTRMEHHSNDLPWRGKCNLKYVEVDKNGRLDLEYLKSLLEKYSGKVKYVSLTAASNVTGYVNDIHLIAKLVHSYGAQIIVDGAQIVAHKKISMDSLNKDESIDFLVFSSHKVYAPFGTGVIIGLKDTFNKLDSDYKGGGTVDTVLDYSEVLFQTPEKNEAGSPNFFGAIALIQSMKEIENIGFDYIYDHEQILLKKVLNGLNSINGIQTYGDSINISDRLGIGIFNVNGMYNSDVAKHLATMRGVFVRQGAFCAHPYIKRLLCLSDEDACKHLIDPNYKMPGMVRVSFGIYNTEEEVDIFLNTVEDISKLYKI